jgi:hypothetical protein
VLPRSGYVSACTGAEPRLLDRVRELIRIKHSSIRTEEAYLHWIRRYIHFHGRRHPRELGADELRRFLSDLAVRRNVSASTQNQALNAILFLYRDALGVLPWIEGVQRAKKPQRLPVVLTRDEVKHVLAALDGTTWLMAALTYGSGLRLLECLRLRVGDLDFSRCEIAVRDGKGQKDRMTCCRAISSIRCALTWRASMYYMNAISPKDSATCICPSRWSASIRTPIATGAGNTPALRRVALSIRDPVERRHHVAPRYCKDPCAPLRASRHAHSLYVVPIRIDQERRVVLRAVIRPQSRRAIVATASFETRCMKLVHGSPSLRAKRDVGAGRSTTLRRVQPQRGLTLRTKSCAGFVL